MWYVMLVIVGTIARQTDWMGGDGVFGPVSNWGTQYWISDSVTVATPGQVSLIATSRSYGNWTKHIVEANAGIPSYAQGLMPADIDKDGIQDLVAYTNNEIVWYKHDGLYNFSPNVIGAASASAWSPCTYPCDLDDDGDIDVLVATNNVGIGWFENKGLPNWEWHALDSLKGYHRVSATDVELDGDIDIVAVDDDPSPTGGDGDIYLFRDTTGNQAFKKELVRNLPNGVGWRVYTADFNNDGYPDIYSGAWNYIYVLLNNQSGNFTLGWTSHIDEWDGAWPADIDGDGDMDLIATEQSNIFGYYALLNNGTGTNFDTLLLISGVSFYDDGAMSCDMDLDGLSDIIGSYSRVGWFRQDSANPLTFTLYNIDAALGGASHWIYAAPLGNCTPSIDLLVTCDGAHIVYENNMLTGFAKIGYLESSILELTPPYLAACDLMYFYYNACVPSDTSLCFYWRAGIDSSGLVTNTWNGPYYAKTGVNIIDSFALLEVGRMFQYKAEFYGDPSDIAVLYEVWLNYECSGVCVEEQTIHTDADLQFVDNKLILYLPKADKIELAIYDIGGRLVKEIFNGYLPSGRYEFDTPQKPGVYFAKTRYAQQSKSLKFIKL
ncbi:MAG: T9SS type A sorting domain-containing protein [Candidatus Stahlbacteria bacterium]|nr:T9SS type A sorting domain-containing protein [Candidatus Stahlbacteria bacterium]